MNILTDADGCPVVDLTLQIVKRFCVPMGFYIGKNGCSKRHPDKHTAEIIRFHFTEPEKTGLYTLWENLTVGYDDLLTTPVVSELTGYSAQSIQRWCNQKILVGFKIRGTLTIPRLAVVEFMSSDRATAIVRKSSKNLDLLRTYAQDCHEGAMKITY